MGELIQVGLAQNRHACGLELLDDGGVVRRHPALEDLGGGRSGDALGNDHVLYGDGNARQFRQPLGTFVGQALVESVSLLQSLLGADA